MELEKKINKLRFYFLLALKELDELNRQNFNENLATAKSCMQEAEILKSQLKKEFEFETLRPFDHELTMLTKQIKVKFDNIVENKRKELDLVSNKIKFLENQKKLLNYYHR